MITIDKLNEYGADTASGINRCAGMEDFYLQLVQQSIVDGDLAPLRSAIEAKDLQKGFEIAHSLKGIFSNLSLTPILEPVSEMTELLRAKQDVDYSALLAQAESALEKLKAL